MCITLERGPFPDAPQRSVGILDAVRIADQRFERNLANPLHELPPRYRLSRELESVTRADFMARFGVEGLERG